MDFVEVWFLGAKGSGQKVRFEGKTLALISGVTVPAIIAPKVHLPI